MNNIGIIIGFIPTVFILFYIVKILIEAFKHECYYFVSYYWTSQDQKGHGNIEVILHGTTIDSYDDMEEITHYIEDRVRDSKGKQVKAIVLNIVKLTKASKNGKTDNILFTDEGIIIKQNEKNI